MRLWRLLFVLYKIRLLSPAGIFRFLAAVYKNGINLMTLLQIARQTYGSKIALVDENETISYDQLFSQSEKLSLLLFEKYQLKNGHKVGLLCKNHASLVRALFAVSRLGADLYLLNSEMSKKQLTQLLGQHDFELLIYDADLGPLLEKYHKNKLLSDYDNLPDQEKVKLPRISLGKLILLTGGTTGKSKEAPHKPSIFNYLNPILGLLTRLNLLQYNTAYIATPIYHGYGVGVLLLFLAIGKKVVISSRFDAERACQLIRLHQVEVVTVVPLMIHKMLQHNPDDLRTLACIASGGAELNPKLTARVFNQLGDVLYNLYGTSEAGLNIIATPEDLKYSPKTVGRKISGVQLKVLDRDKQQVETGTIGQFCIKNTWSMKNSRDAWIGTGDLGYQDEKGYYFLCGRIDDMIVSGGENVYPLELERELVQHPKIEEAAVVGMDDEMFGQRLKAFVLLADRAGLSVEEIYNWLRPRVARFQIPKEIVIVDHLPYTPVGKLDRKQLKSKD